MSQSDNLTATFSVDRSPDQVFAAVTDVRGWWSRNIIGDTAAPRDEFVFTDDSAYPGETVREHRGIRFCRFRITEAVPGERIVWRCVDADLTFIDDRDEWTDTTVVFDITPSEDGATLRFVHEGLTAGQSECFTECSRGWNFYITESLPELITTGTGRPIPAYSG